MYNGTVPIPTVIDSIDLEYICKYICCNETGEAYYRFGWSNVVHKCFDNQRDFPGTLDSEQLSLESRFLIARGAILGKMLDAQWQQSDN